MEARQIDQACDRFEAAWKAGRRPDAADFLDIISERARSVLLRQLLLLDWEYRRRAGDNPQSADYQERFPADTAVIDSVGREMAEVGASTHVDTAKFDALDTPWAGDDDPTALSSADSGAVLDLSRYDLLDEVGQGGIGVVYRGRDRLLGRDLAIKVLREEYRERPDARRRFVKEARIGSQLQHPAIVPVYELSKSADGWPFFTMKLVEGHTLAGLLHDRPRSADSTPRADMPRLLAVFEQVCQAMAYAHSNGVVHRDLKPANVMVGAFGEVQVMDWGFAKVLAGDNEPSVDPDAPPSAAKRPGATQSGALMGTPAYMSPEQARGEAALIDARADVFALGAILCEILSGRPPYADGPADEVCRQAATADLHEARARLHACCADSALRDLALRCLAADRACRPEDAGIVAREMTAYLASAQARLQQAQTERAAAEARAEEAGAKARAERRARRLTLALTTALLLVAGAASWQTVVANGARRDADASARAENSAKLTAEQKEAEARAALDFVENKVFATVRPNGYGGGIGPNVTVRQALVAALPFVGKNFADQPLVEARLRMTLGRSFSLLGEEAVAVEQFEAAREIYTTLLGVTQRDTLDSMDRLAASYGILGRDDGEAALKLHKETLALSKEYLGPDDTFTFRCMNNLAMSYFDRKRYDEAIGLIKDTLALKTAKLGPHNRSTLTTSNLLANCYNRVGRLPEAIELRKETLGLQSAHLGPEDVETIWTMSNLATDYRKVKRHTDALPLDEQALALRKKVLTPDHPDTLVSMWGVAEDLIGMDRGRDAVPILDECLRLAVGKRVLRNFPKVAELRLRVFEKAKDTEGCRATAELWEMQQRTDATSLYQAACCRAVTAKILRDTDATRAADNEADRAMAWLRKAIAAGFKDAAKLKADPDLDALRGRGEFGALTAGLESQR
jgi:tetratricopeptide (TPR) repeat protein